MADHSTIEWTDATWNPITGCALASEGCRHCYAARLAATRLRNHPSRAGLARLNAAGEAKFTGQVRFNEEWLTQPLQWKRPRRIFVCAHGDLFAEGVPDEWIDRVFAVMALSPHHTFQVLTKRAKRMREYLSAERVQQRWAGRGEMAIGIATTAAKSFDNACRVIETGFPLPNVWLGVSAERQQEADERVPELLATPAAIRFVSAEPLLGPIDFTRICLVPQKPGSARAGIHLNALAGRYCESGMPYVGEWDVDGPYPTGAPTISLDQIIVGGESGQHARPMHPNWARRIRDDCAAAGVPFFFKQWGEWEPVSETRRDAGEWGREWMLLDRRGIVDIPDDRVPMEEFGEVAIVRVGKKRAGRLLDGVEHNGMPVAREVPAL